MEIKSLISWLNQRTVEYDKGCPTVSDEEWDEKYFKLEQLEKETGIIFPDSPTQTIKYDVVNSLEKVVHNHKMLSLDKTKDWNEFLSYFEDKSVIGMLKLDGLTCSLRYLNGSLVSAETRGNGIVGENILHNARVLTSIPRNIPYQEELVVDGEIICTEEGFKPFADEYSNQRNFASGSIRLLDSKECAKRNLTFVVWNIVKGFSDDNSFLSRLQKVDKLGFTVVPWTSSFNWDAKEYLVDKAKKLGYPIDGLVGRFDDITYGESLGETGHHAKSAYAFKFYDESVDTFLRNIEWSMGRMGQITPIACFDKIMIENSEVSRASLHNLTVMETTLNGLGFPGQKVSIIKANAIIPQISWAEADINDIEHFKVPDKCPICGEALTIQQDNESKILVCTNSECNGKLLNRLDYFLGRKGLDIKGLSKATIGKLIDWGWLNSCGDVFSLSRFRDEWIKKDGFGSKSVDKILAAIDEGSHCDLDAYICALGIPLIGSTASKALAATFKTWNDFINAVESNYSFYQLANFGREMSQSILSFDYTEARFIAHNFISFKTPSSSTSKDGLLQGKVIVITGKLEHFKNRDELKALIESHGGKVASSISSKTSYLINNDSESNSSKNQNAKKLNIPILSEKEFLEKFDF